MKILVEAYRPGSETGSAPYARAVYDWNWGDNNAHLGGAVFVSRSNPAIDVRSVNGTYGHDSYTDLFLDSGYQLLRDDNRITLAGHYDYEIQNSHGLSAAQSPYQASGQPHNNLSEMRATATHYYLQTYGATVSWERLWGKQTQLLYNTGANDGTGSANGSPDSNDVVLEADCVPFGKQDSWAKPFANLKLGVQYTIHTQFNGGGQNYDGFGRSASDNDTLYLFAWTIF